jgi:hypothetical protein
MTVAPAAAGGERSLPATAAEGGTAASDLAGAAAMFAGFGSFLLGLLPEPLEPAAAAAASPDDAAGEPDVAPADAPGPPAVPGADATPPATVASAASPAAVVLPVHAIPLTVVPSDAAGPRASEPAPRVVARPTAGPAPKATPLAARVPPAVATPLVDVAAAPADGGLGPAHVGPPADPVESPAATQAPASEASAETTADVPAPRAVETALARPAPAREADRGARVPKRESAEPARPADTAPIPRDVAEPAAVRPAIEPAAGSRSQAPAGAPEPPTPAAPDVERLVALHEARPQRIRDDGAMRLEVEHEQLGPIELRVAVRDHGVRAELTASHEHARDALVAGRASLEAALDRAQLRLDTFDVQTGGQQHRPSAERDARVPLPGAPPAAPPLARASTAPEPVPVLRPGHVSLRA